MTATHRKRVQHRSPRPKAPASALSLAPGNRLLASLPPLALARLAGDLEPVHLERREVLFRAHEPLRVIHFPVSAVISFVSRLETGDSLEVGLVGRDGLTGTALRPGVTAMSCDGIVQIPGLCLRMSADRFRGELRSIESLREAVDRYTHVLLLRSMQMSTCNMFHSVEQRCIRWLLAVHDLIGDEDMPLTHELIATMLGVHRPTVTLTLGTLHRKGLVNEARGRVVICDRPTLEAACCECYRVMSDGQRRLLGY